MYLKEKSLYGRSPRYFETYSEHKESVSGGERRGKAASLANAIALNRGCLYESGSSMPCLG